MKKIVTLLCVFFVITFLSVNSYAKYVIENTNLVANINIDATPPKIELIYVTNSNENNNKYANKTHTIVVQFRVVERNVKKYNMLMGEQIKFYMGDTEFFPKGYDLNTKESQENVYYTFTLRNLDLNGELKIVVKKGSIVDIADQENEETVLDTGIIIDNTSPVVTYIQEKMADGKVNAKIKTNEEIKSVEGWNLSNDKKVLSKEFSCNAKYPFVVTDLAGNNSNIDVVVDKATNIKIKYGAMKKGIWQYGTGLNEIVGENGNEKIEAISLYTEGIEKDFIQMRCLVDNGLKEEKEGENINKSGYKILENGILEVGGMEMDKIENIENDIEPGIKALSIKLRDDDECSVVYQVWVRGIGWLEPASDGEESTYDNNKSIKAYRFSIVPKSEKQYLIDLWNEDVDTNYLK